jgi:hypothetical protein
MGVLSAVGILGIVLCGAASHAAAPRLRPAKWDVGD